MKKLDDKQVEDIFALTPLQEGILFHYLDNSENNRDIYCEQLILDLSGEVDINVFKKAWNFVVETNEMLRTLFRWEKIENPVQMVLKPHEYKIDLRYYSFPPDAARTKRELITRIKNRDKKESFDLNQVPFRITLGKIRENRCVMIISHHHILYDGWSTGIILKEFFQAYRQFTNRNQLLKPKPPVKTKFKEFIKWIQHQDIPKQERYWKKYLKGLNAGTEIPIKAKTGKRTEIKNKSPGNLIVQLPLDLQKEIECFVKTHKVTLAALVYSSWGLLLQKYNNCSDVVFGTTVSGRSARVTGIENIVGLFINTLPLRVVSRTTENISELVHKIDESLKQREEYENTPLVKIKEYSEIDSRQELFNTVMVIENYPLAPEKLAAEKIQENSSLTIDSYSSLEMTHYDLTIIIRESNGGIQIKFLYPNGLFYESAIERMPGHFTHMMQDMLKKPGDAPHRVELLSREERRRILVDFCDTDADYPNSKTIHRMFEEIVDQVPDRIALVAQAGVIPNKGVSCGGIQLSYCELNNRSNRLAHLLRLKGVQPDSVVAITAERSAEMIIGILAILKAGGAYLPIDPDYPQERINYMLKDSNVRLIIKKSEIRNPKSETYPNEPNSNDQYKKAGVTVLDFEHLNFEFSIGCPRRGLSNFEIRALNLSPSNLAYVIYTSGSTGKPKGVLVEHAPVINLLAGLNRDYSFGETGVYLLKTSYVFDVSVTELFGWFWGRSKLAVLEKDGEKDPQKILNTIERIGVTHINFVPSLFHAFVDYMHLNPQNIVKCSGLRYIFLAGEALFPALVKHFEELNLENRLENLYGPTEAAVYASGYSLSQWDGQGSIPIGKPLANIRLYILDRFVQLQPIGMPGELGISGAGLARGYLNQPGLTAEKFVRIEVKVDEEEYRSYRSHRSYINHLSYIYKTGDLVRWLPDGNIEFLGRIDQQVKIRGYRVELGEIENWLLKHHQVKEALVLAREKENNEKYLCAYIIPAATGAIDDFTSISTGIKEYLSKKLPAYMIPTCFVGLPKMPLTVSGKINRNALPEPEVGPTLEYVSPRNKTEELMAAIWAKVLGIGKKPIGIDDNFFQLGGHSLTATRLAARIHKVFDLEIPPKQLFNTPTIRGLVLYIGESARSSFTPCEPVEKKEYYALSSAQRRLFVLQRLDVLHTTYNITGMVQLEGRLHPEVFDRCFRELLHRYESLRTSFHMVAGEPVQRIHKSIKFEIEYYDKKEVEVKVGDSEGTRGLAPLPIELVGRKAQSAEHDAQCIEWNKERHAPCAMRYTSFIRPFDLSRAPLLRVIFINISRENHLLVVDIHHIAADGVSIGMLIHELMSLYSGEPEKLPPIKIQYKDFSEWKNRQKVSEAVKKQEAYWVNEFAGEIPVLNLPGDYPRPPGPSSAGSTEGFEISERETAALQRYHRETGTTLFMLLLAIFNVWLSKLSSQEDIVVGTPETGRHYLEFENVIGMFVNTLALRNRPIGEKQFSRLLKEVKERTLEAFENRDYPFENLVEKVGPRGDLSRSPLFDVMFALQDPDSREIKLPGLSVKMVDYENPTSKFDLALEARESAGKLDFKIQYSTRLFKPQTIKRFITYFKELILSLLENPGTRISRANILPPGEKQAILYDFNNTAMEYPGDKNWLQLFEEQADKSPGLTCAVFEHQHITYKELNEKAICLAILLGKKGVRRGTIVGVMADRSLELMIGIIGILKSGGIYLPITPAYPTARVNYMIADTNAWLLLTGKIYQEKAKESSQQEVIFLDEEWGKFKERENPGNSNKKGKGSRGLPYQCSEVAYIIYTSGSTGRPKGSIIQHTALLNFIFSMYKNYNYDFSKRDNCLSLTSISFDVSICELFLPLIFGSTIVLLRDDKVFDAEAIASTIIERSVTFTYLPPALLRDTFANLIGDRLKTALNKLLVGVEPIKDHVLESFFKLNNKMRIINGYGPTEATICASNYIYRSHKTSGKIVPIGKPLGNTGIYIVDKNETPVPIGIGGELCISGAGLSRGYLNRPELTAGKFCLRRPVGALFEKSAPPGPPCKNFLLLPLPHYPIYMTGDLARWQPDGNIEFLGRIDNQIKIRGIRVEPGEIENALLEIDIIKEAVVIPIEKRGEKYLCAYIVSPGKIKELEPGNILAQKLPRYMVPSYFMQLEKIPLNPSGKPDRNALPIPNFAGEGGYTPPGNALEKKLTEIWSEVLQVEKNRISIETNFFKLGGHSLNATSLAAKIHHTFDVKIPLTEIFQSSTIKQLAQYLGKSIKEKHHSIEPGEKKEYYPLSPGQKRIYVLWRMEPDSLAYNIPVVMEVTGQPVKKQLEYTFKKLIHRHESFRTLIEIVNDEPVQRICDEVEFEIDYDDLTVGDLIHRYPESQELRAKNCIDNFIQPFDLYRAPLLRVGITKIAEEKHLLMIDMSHIISDGVSSGVMAEEFMLLYRGDVLPQLRIQYKDFSRWQKERKNKKELNQQQDYWLREFAGGVPLLNLPVDFTRPAIQKFVGKTSGFEIEMEKTAKLKALALTKESTLYIVLLAIYNILLGKLGGQEEIVVGTPVSGRDHNDIERVIGILVNTLALKNYPAGEKTFNEFLEEVKRSTLKAQENQDYPFENLVENLPINRDTSRNPLFDVMLVMQNMRIPGIKIPGLILVPYEYDMGISKFDLTFHCQESEGKLSFRVEYSTKLFKESTIDGFIGYFKKILCSVIDHPHQRLSGITIISEAEKERLLVDFNRTTVQYPGDKTLHRLFREQAERTPHHIALIKQIPISTSGIANAFGQMQITYRQLNERSNQLAYVLMEKGVQPDTIVGIMLERSPEMIIAILGILKAGGAYMPIDPDYPLERINFMLADSNAGVLLTTPKLQVKVKAKVKLITLTSSLKPSASTLTSNSTCQVSPANLAYVIYTSGSTGRPKSVMIEHKSVVNLLFAQQHTYPFKQTDAYLLKTSYVFDVSVTELFGWYMGEGRLVILEKGAEKDPGAILDSIERHRVTHVNFVPSMFNAFTDYLTGEHRNRLAGLKYIFLAGEALLPVLVEKFRDLGTNILLENIYGPTESTVYASQYSLAEWEGTGPIPIGKPLSNLNLYILDKNGYIQPINIAGELCISGIGLARGYLNQPGLTSEKFVKIEIKAEVEEEEYRSYRSPGSYITHLSYIYKTGDLARWQPDGNIEFLGRIDNQIKIRGIRVEPGEIENALLEIDIIKEAVVIPIEKRGEKYLCAYIVSPGKIKELEPGNILAQKLPRYMVPSYFMQLEKIPLNPSGKPDRNALPITNFAGEGGYSPPGNALEKKLTEIWSEVLQVEKNRISIETNFFKLGGHSLNATSLAAKIHHTFDVKIPLTEIFQSSTIKQLAQYLEKSIKEKHHSIDPGEKKEYYPLSPGQKRIYVLWRMEPDSLAYNIPVVMEVTGQPVKKQLEYTFKKLIHRHESFRTLIEIVNDEPVQRICDEVEFEIEYDDLTKGDLIHRYPESQELRAKNCIDNFIQPFDLYRAPLLRVGITKIAEEKHLLMIDMSHIISDGVSSGVMAEEFMLLYRGDVLPQLRIQYKDFSRWQKERKNKKELNQQQDYWLREFADGVPLLNLPADFTRPAIQKFAGKTSGFEIEMEKTAKLKALALTKESTLYIVLLAIYNILLGKLGGQEEIVVGTPVSGRDHNDIERVIGILVNTLALKNYPAGEKTFNEFLEEVKRSTLKAQENQDYPFENLVENLPINRDTRRNPLFDVMLVMQNMRIPGIKIPGLILVPYEYDMGISKFDLTFHCQESEGKLSFRVEYSTKLFKESTIDGFIGYFKKILCSVIDHPHQRLSGITIISEAEKERLLVDFNRTTVQYPGDKTLHRLFREQAERTPHHIALIKQIPISTSGIAKAFGQMQITYCQLNERSNQLAYVLMEKGVQPDTIVGIMLERSPEMIIAILGILKAGGAYMPIDPDYPLERKKFMLDDANAHILLTSSFLTGGSDFEFKGEIFPLDDMGLYSDSGKDAGGGRPPGSVNKAGNPAYIMYTSGSTGRPKGVVVGHRNVVRLVINTNYVELTEKTRILQTGVPVFDAATFEIWGALLNSGQLVLVDKETILEAKRLGQALKRHKINTLWLTSPLFNQLAAENREIFSPLDYLLVGGDVLSPRFINLVRDKNKALKIINGYGPTENTTFSTTFLIDKNFEQAIPIGRPINNSTAFILDRNGRLQPIGIFGELWVGGDGVSKGYLNNPELTAEKFVKVEVKVEEEEYRSYRSHRSYITHLSYIYNTGDLARWLPNGNIEFLGRIDNQVKIRGFRIEPGEIESRLSNHKEIKDVVVVARQQENGDKYLCAYIVPGKKLTASQLREYLTGRLPDYMIPSFFVTLERIPLTGHGKVDRNALPEPETRGIEKNYTAPTNEWEEKLEGLWSKVLGIPKEKIGIEANFFRIGGHSLKATLMVSKIHKEFNVSVPLSEVFRTPTIKELARYTKRAKTDIHASVEPVEKKEYYALSPAQERLYILHRMDVNSTGYNMPGAVSLEEDIEIDKLQGIFRELIVRHESLRTSIEMINDEPRQKIHDQVAFEIEYYDLQVTGESDRCRWKEEQSLNFEGTGRLAPLPVKNFIRPFDLSQAPLLRVGLIKRERGKHILLLDLHHIISDGTSQEILTKELKALYSNWGEELTPLKLQYKDYAGWQHSLQWQKLIKQQQTFWLRWFSPPGQVPVLDLPTDYPRPSIQRFDLGSTVNFVLNPEETKGLRDIAHHNETTLYMVILAVFTILLSKLSGQEDIVIGTPVAGRRHVDIEPIIGIFLNTLAMRNFPEGNQTFSLFLKKVKNRTLAAFENQEYPFEDLVDQLSVQRDTSRNPLFDVMINLLNQAEYPGDFTGDFDNEDIPAQYIRMASKFDLNLKILDLETKLFFSLEYHTQLFKKETVERIIGYFNKIIRSVTRDPQARISVIDIIPEARKKEIISSFNEDMTVQLEPGTLQGRLSDSFQRHGQRTAVEYSAIQVTYEQLDKQSAYIANWIMENGIPPGSFIGIFTGNRLDEILLVTGILKAGCIFAPLDIMLPIKRILGMIREIGLRVIFTDVTNEKRLIDSLGDLNGIKCITADDSFFKRDEGLPGLNSSGRYNSDDPLYLFFTSGTSGTPKAIVGCNKSILHFVNWEIDTFKIDETFRIALVSRTGFDPFLRDVFVPLCAGGTVCIPGSDEILLIPDRFASWIENRKINLMHLVPSVFKIIDCNRVKRDSFKNLKYVLLAGEAAPAAELQKWFAAVGERIQFVNMYGPTETTQSKAYYLIKKDDAREPRIPIGKPIPGARLILLDKNMNVCPPGIVGEIYIRTPYRTFGYYKTPGLNKQRFIPNPFGDKRNDKNKNEPGQPGTNIDSDLIYRSGDLGRQLENGDIEIMGRVDRQIKVRGNRIEPGEIEAVLLRHKNISAAVVVGETGKDDDIILCAYTVSGIELSVRELRDYLAGFLPGYMIPSYFVSIDRIPLTHRGKVDLQALPAPGLGETGDTYIAPGNALEEKLVEIWSEVLKIEPGRIGIDNNFFELGGHSLKATIAAAKIHKAFDVKMSLVDMFRYPSIRELSVHINTRTGQDRYLVIPPAEQKTHYPLSPAQKRLYILQQMDEIGTGYHITLALDLIGTIDIHRLEKSFQKLIRRHESLRTSFVMIDDEPAQLIHDRVDFKINQKQDISDFIQPFDLSKAPLLRVGLLELPHTPAAHRHHPRQGTYYSQEGKERKYILVVDMHHIISDAVSRDILIRDFTVLYRGRDLVPLRLQYKDFSQWQNSHKIKKGLEQQKAYWLDTFTGEIPVLNLPTDYQRPQIRSFAGKRIGFALENQWTKALGEMALEEETTLFMVLLAFYSILLSKICSQEDIPVGTVVAGRRHADLEKVIGMFVNTVVIGTWPRGEKRFRDFLKEVMENSTAAFDNQDYPFDELVEQVMVNRDTQFNPLFDAAFGFLDNETAGEGAGKNQLPGLVYKVHDYDSGISKFDLSFYGLKNGQQLTFVVEYSTKLFKEETIQRFINYFKEIISIVMENKNIQLKSIHLIHDLYNQKIDMPETGFDF